MKKSDINNLIVVSDIHTGCKLAVCPPGEIELDEGGKYKQSRLQKRLYVCWRYFWDEWVPLVTREEPYVVVINGDAIDGVHHNSVTQISHNLTDQIKIAEILLRPIAESLPGRFYFIRGTESHTGQSAQYEEMLAKNLNAVRDEDGRYARWELRARIGVGLVHLSHHIGTSSSLAYETSAIMRELQTAYVEASRWSEEPPDCIVRSHRHRNCEARVRMKKHGRSGFATCCTTAAWQLKTPFAYRRSSGVRPQIGGTLVRWGGEDMYTRHCIWDIEETKIETPA